MTILTSRPRIRALTVALAGSLALASCAYPTPYQPATGVGQNRTGYWDEQIESNRFRVSFAGNSLTSRETVERYLLFRAAQLTLEQGYDHFILFNRDTERTTRTYVDRSFGPGPFGYWSPYWRYYRPHYGWGFYDPFYDDPFWGPRGFDTRTIDRYEAMAEIVLGRGPKPENVRAFDARDVIERLGPSVMTPQAR
ncbi:MULTISPECIES: CC0125/CC1285 family lipoprotein [unclassified Sphingosinithalassobacter]|uniref:CC0125/CC1285 family lipoprotein n=1 Tax=unclassified Sphingosinithalassobacter TaxID=2676235 RepID=UPI00165E95C4|nr:hypothetical protein [Sphingosinithalassobacter sp. CS137]